VVWALENPISLAEILVILLGTSRLSCSHLFCETMCNEVQTVGALSAINRGFEAAVGTAFEMNLEASTCTYCGQCVAVCPTAALTEVDHTPQVIRAIADPTKTVVVQTAPAVRAALGEEFGMEVGTLVTGQMVTALRNLGFNHVFDTDFAADLTIMEEGTELLGRLNAHLAGDKSVKLPILTSCCPGWVNFFETQFPDMKDIPSTARSPQQMFGPIAKTYFAQKLGVKREDMVVVSIMPCLAKKYEAQRDEFKVDGNPDVDFSITTRELAHLIKQANMDLNTLEKSEFDQPMGESTGAGVIFGTTGGVIEAAARLPHCLAIETIDDEVLMVMEDLDESGYPLRKDVVTWKEITECLAWLAKFHASYLGKTPDGLWEVGSYWHLETRPQELAVLADRRLKKAAPIIDEKLNSCEYKTFVHGDAKLANFCFTKDGQVSGLDFQYVGGGCGMKDVAYFIGSCLDENDCERLEVQILDTYFDCLQNELKERNEALEREWRSLYRVAWADFHRFLKGWSPGHWKINTYSERVTQEVINNL